MDKKRLLVFAGFFLFSIIVLSFLVSADTTDLVTGIQDFFKPILKPLFGVQVETNLFEMLLFALIIVAAAYMALDRVAVIRQNGFALWTITIAVAILAVRFIATEEIVDALLLPQGVFGIALLTIIPFALYFWFVEFGLSGTGSRVLRKVAWITYAVVWVVIWYKQMYTGTPSAALAKWGYLYLLVALVSVVFLFFDKTIQNAIRKSQAQTHKETSKEILRAGYVTQLRDIEKKLETIGLPEQTIAALENRRKELEGRLDRIDRT